MNSMCPSDALKNDRDELLTSALFEKLRLTPEERIEAHQAALELFNELRAAGERLRSKNLKLK